MLIAEWRASGKTCEAFCSRRGTRPGTLKWRAWNFAGEAKLSKAPVSLVPVRVPAQVSPSVVMLDLEVRRKLREECLKAEWFASLREARVAIESCRAQYGDVHPHSSLGYRTPHEFKRRPQQSESTSVSM